MDFNLPFHSISTILAFVEFVLLVWAIFILSEAFYWRRFNLITASNPASSDFASQNGDPPPSKARESSFNHALATVSIKVNAVFQVRRLTALEYATLDYGIDSSIRSFVRSHALLLVEK